MLWMGFAFTSAILVALALILTKKALFKEHALQFSATLAIFNMVFALPLFFVIDYSRLQLTPLVVLFFASVLGAIAFYFLAKSVRHLDISVVSPLRAMGPGIVALIAFIFLNERLTNFQIGGILFLIIGSYILETQPHHKWTEPILAFIKSRYIHLLIFVIIIYSITSNFDRLLVDKMGLQVEAFIAFAHVFLAIHLLIMIRVLHGGFQEIRDRVKTGWLWLLPISLLTIGYRYTQLQALTLANVGLVVALISTSSFFSTLIGGELFHEKNLLRRTFASLVILIGVVMILI